MKVLKIILAILVLATLAVPLLSCSSKSAEAEQPQNQIATIQTGNITTSITAAGNLALSQTQDLPINLFYQGGTVGRGGTIGQVLVEVGDSAQKGQLLVTVDPDEWTDQLTTLKDQVTSQERNLQQAKVNVQTANQTLQTSRDSATTKKTALLNAQSNLEQAQDDLDTARSTADWTGGYTEVEAALDRAKTYYDYLIDRGTNVPSDRQDGYQLALEKAKDNLEIAQKNYDNFVAGLDAPEISINKKEVEVAQNSVVQAQQDITALPETIALNEQQVKLTEGKVQDAQQALTEARDKLTKAQGMSPEIRAPFDGFITAVNVKAGDNVYNGTIAVTIADPNKFESNIVVNEMDILQVRLGQEAIVQLNALPGINLSANVSFISPTATISSGVVNYQVKVELKPLEAASSAPPAGQPAMPSTASGQFQRPPTGTAPSMGGAVPPGQRRPSTGQAGAVPKNIQLKDGLTATVSIIASQKNNVLVVPNAAITNQGGKPYVQVMLPAGTSEQRAIQTGITDYQNTEVISGLSEGEKVIIPQATTVSSTTTSSQARPTGPMPFFGPPPRR